MEGFKLSKRSWHYRLVRWGGNWRSYENFCDYFWAVIRAILKCIFFVSVGLGLLGATCFFTWTKPFIVLGVVSLSTLIICGGVRIEEFKDRRARVVRGPGFFMLKYKSFKERFCPKIEWVA